MNSPIADPQLVSVRTPPHSIEAEQSVLGGLLLDNAAWDRIADMVRADDFYRHDHRLIFQHISRLIDQSRPADAVTVYESLQTAGKSDDAGGLAYLNTLAQNTPSAANIRRYGEIVRDRAVLRRLVTVGDEITTAALNPQGKDTKTVLDEAESKVFRIAEEGARGRQGFVEIEPLLTKVVERIQELFERANPSDVTGVPTGFTDVDRMTSGLQPGDLIIVAGRPSMGKAQPLDAQVRTRLGWKAMGELRVGDALASIDGQPSEVTGVFSQSWRQVFRIRLSDGRSTRACAEHLWRVNHREWPQPRVLRTDQLQQLLARVRYRNRLWIDCHVGDFGHEDALPVDPWLLGALLGDGALSGTALRFSTASEEMLARLRARVAATEGAEMAVTHAGKYDYRLIRADRGHVSGVAGSCSNPLRGALEELGLWGRNSIDKFVPRIYLDARREVRRDVLRGLLDTDGWAESWGSVRFCTSSRQLAEDVAELVRSLGGWCSLSGRRPRYRDTSGASRPGRPAWVCHIHHPEPRSLFLLSEKQARLPERWLRTKRLTLSAIEADGEAECQCISVSHPSRLYVTDQDVLTHNTAFALNIGEHVAIDQGLPVAVFSMEMGAAQLALRMLSSVGRINQQRLRTGRLEDGDWPKLTAAIQKMHDAQLFIDESPALNALELRARARRLARTCGKLGLIVIDYLQLMSASSMGENRATEISEISRSLKALAKELQVPVVALSQLNRTVEQRTDKRPVMSDLRESGAIEQDADVIFALYREEFYNPDTPDKGVAEVLILKQRNGPTGRLNLRFAGENTRFDNLAQSFGGSAY